MAENFNIYNDAGLTLLNSPSTPKASSLAFDGSSGNVDYQIWLGSPVTGRVIQAASNPGVDYITLTVTALSGTGLPEQPDTFRKIALSQVGLDTADQTLNVAVSILGGVANAVPIWVRDNVSAGVNTPATYVNLVYDTNDLAESAV